MAASAAVASSGTPTLTHVPIEQYLHTDYSPDVDYVDGELENRYVGENDHSAVQGALMAYFQSRRITMGVRVRVEQRIRISEVRYRVPDVCLLDRERPVEPIYTYPPLVCIEVLSPEDRILRFQEKVKHYFDFGVKGVWILDPSQRNGLLCTSPYLDGWKRETVFRVAGTRIEMVLEDVFREVD